MKTDHMNIRIFNRDVIKLVAMLAMLLNHIAAIELFPLPPALHEVMEDIGYFTAPVMCFFLVEGFHYTGSRKQYGIRLMLFAVISQIPYGLVAQDDSFNMIYTLLCSYLTLIVMEQFPNTTGRTVLCALLVMATMNSDWALIAPMLTILLYRSAGDREKMAWGFGITYIAFSLCNMIDYAEKMNCNITTAVMHGALSGLGILAAAFTVLVFYNGKRIEHGKEASKWFFYIFYPTHLLILYLLKNFVLI